tara:strand:+ start:7113 stop:7217 length:105 start_codon:yes stop_codon:yes gene_type:complete
MSYNNNNNDDPWVYLIIAGAIFIAVVYITGFSII